MREMIALESELVNRDIQINSISQELESVKNENTFCQNEIKNLSAARAVLAQQNDDLNDANQKLKLEMGKIENVGKCSLNKQLFHLLKALIFRISS